MSQLAREGSSTKAAIRMLTAFQKVYDLAKLFGWYGLSLIEYVKRV